MLEQAIRTNKGEQMGQYIRDLLEATRRAEREAINDDHTEVLNNYMEQMRQRRVSNNDCEIIGTIVMCSCGRQVVVTDMSMGTECPNCKGTIKIDRVIQKAYVVSTPMTDGLARFLAGSGGSWV